jgi:hypothetical protein
MIDKNKIIENLEELVEYLGEDCRFDHHGCCQEHALQEGEDCMVFKAKQIIKELKDT